MKTEKRYRGIKDILPRRTWPRSRKRTRITFVLGLLCVCTLYRLTNSATKLLLSSQRSLICPENPISNEILVVLRTGATEALEKLPVHFDTTLRCVPKFVIYSDYNEVIQGHEIYDVFAEVSDDLKKSVPDFDIYHRLKAKGREGLAAESHVGSGTGGSLDNPSWKLDKFKFLPMVDQAWRQSPGAQWFVFIEADTYLVWANLLEYLSKFNPTTPMYIGKQMLIGNVYFAHGGSGFVLSRAAMEKVTQHRRAHMDEYNRYTISEWAGDMILGKVLKDVNIPLVWAFPHFQGDPLSLLDHNISKIDKTTWCYPAITYHHMPPDEIRLLWEYEQDRQLRNQAPMRHVDVFRKLVLPSLRKKKDGWDNYSINSQYSITASNLTDEEIGALPRSQREAHESFAMCMAACEYREKCLQFSFSPGRCSLSDVARLGRKADHQCLEYSNAASKCSKYHDTKHLKDIKGVVSGWRLDRIMKYAQDMDQSCPEDGRASWVT